MHGNVAQDLNRRNFLEAYRALKRFDAFPFFGTLLGLVREGDIIEHDDDVDFYVDVQHRNDVRYALLDVGFTDVTPVSDVSPMAFMQFCKKLEEVDTYVDIYLYETSCDGKFIVDKWNFIGKPNYESCHLNVECELIFPLMSVSYFGQAISLPRKPDLCCEFLYGPSWKIKRSKSALDYMVFIYRNSPIIFEEGDYIFEILKARAELETWSRQLVAARDWWKQRYDTLDEQYTHTRAVLMSQSEWLRAVQEGKDWLENQWQQSLTIIEEQKAIIDSFSAPKS